MDIRVLKEIQKALVNHKAYTDFRKFISETEQLEYPICSCGRKALYISYCTMMKIVCTLCEDCYRHEQGYQT